MNRLFRILFVFMLLVVIARPETVQAKGLPEDEVVFGGAFRLESGETLDGSLIIVGGIATLESGSTVTQDVILLGGTVKAAGVVHGNVVGLGGLITLDETALVEGNLAAIGAHLDRADGARVEGEITETEGRPFTFTFPGSVQVPRISLAFSPVFELIWFVLKIFLWTALAVLAMLFVPAHAVRVSAAAVRQPVAAGGLGLLSLAVLVTLALTIILLPAALILGVLVAIAWVFGLVALGLEIGTRISRLFNQDWIAAISAGIGTFILMLVLNGLSAANTLVGFIFSILVGFVGLGAVLLTRFGTRSYPLV